MHSTNHPIRSAAAGICAQKCIDRNVFAPNFAEQLISIKRYEIEWKLLHCILLSECMCNLNIVKF
jgi:hypothetical protein